MLRYPLPLTDNFVFKSLFSHHEDILLDLLNSFPEFQASKKILSLKVLNPELPKLTDIDKLSVLDIHAEDVSGNKFLIEMQSEKEESFPNRILYYWSKIYSKTLKKGNDYNLLKKVYSINFIKFNFLPSKKFYSVFELRERLESEIVLTEDLEIHIIELPKFHSELLKLNSEFESWVFALKNGHELKGVEMNTLTKKNPKLKKVFKEYKEYTLSTNSRAYQELKKKSEMVMNSRLSLAMKESKLKGKLEGKLEGELETALKFLDFGMSITQVSKITGIPKKEILSFREKQLSNKS
ncbi:MAG: Rpn family recombination-promoting nuclease/putative transposase [Leptospiraceae bacterium]|nr:Rpn family recombination-promoting nuclease/putative transposase [Leptospiraceae bacterium]